MKLLCVLLAAATVVAAPASAADTDTITIGFTASRTGPLNVDSTGQERALNSGATRSTPRVVSRSAASLTR
jgi:hypothetical protein